MWGHGCYDRKADRSADGQLNPVSVPRFRCPSCRRTCSRLPLCICPRRWYGWALQQQVLAVADRRCVVAPRGGDLCARLSHRASLVAIAVSQPRDVCLPSTQPLCRARAPRRSH
ncbi:DUF6431 domain-containing protein [Burkholderia mayonis]|uniref:DUF6431 domain-containing protein n=1 Tax=Burkholderia TaxID=32008 RepID=UPI001CF79B19|nr:MULTISPECIES: DUF6431 domain-containing protein [Burkholderia]